MVSVEIIADSQYKKARLTTFLVTFPKIILPQVLTHRVFERCASSNRAIPTHKKILQVSRDPYTPSRWGKLQTGMQAYETLNHKESVHLDGVWRNMARDACQSAETLLKLNVHKQWANRVLEPFDHTTMVITATEWDNFFNLRCMTDAQDEINELANLIQTGLEENKPRMRRAICVSSSAAWHLPFVTNDERKIYGVETLLAMSCARTARTSYLNQKKLVPEVEDEVRLFKQLTDSKHYSAISHCCRPIGNTDNYTHTSRDGAKWSGCVRGWTQLRYFYETGNQELI